MTLEQTIDFSDFDKVEMKVGKIIKVEDFPRARNPSYKVWIDFGNKNVRKCSAQLTNYAKEELLNRQIIAVTNFPTKQIADFMSEVLILGVPSSKGVIILKPEQNVDLGVRVY